MLPRGAAWLDSGTFEALNDAGNYVRALEARQATEVAAPEEVAWRMGFIDDARLEEHGHALLASGYGRYLLDLLLFFPPPPPPPPIQMGWRIRP